jgi:integrase/recombinase XerD
VIFFAEILGGPGVRAPPRRAGGRRTLADRERVLGPDHPHTRRTVRAESAKLRDVQIAARHADPRTTMRYDRARKNLDRHPNYILAADMASGT